MKILITGSGGREHGLAWRVAQGAHVERVYVAPGNAGTALESNMENVAIDPMDFAAQIAFAKDNDIALTIIGPEDPLVAGVVDAFQAAGLACFGPSKQAAQLEGSKTFTKEFLVKYDIPTAAYQSFDDVNQACAYIRTLQAPVVVKADGLAAGKGVVVAQTLEQAEQAVIEMLSGEALGTAGSRVVVEEFLQGEEASFIVIADGEHFISFASSQDHKAAYDGDKGPNTGGMGAYSPAPVVTPEVHKRILDQVIKPTIEGMKKEGHPYTGFLYAGLMIDPDGYPKVIEFNCRFGDPETQPIMVRMQSDLVELCLAALSGDLDQQEIKFDERSALTVVVASGGYPGKYATGKAVDGLNDVADARVFHAGTKLVDGQVTTAGGRVFGVTALGKTVSEAQQNAYEAVARIRFDGISFRTDIGYRAVEREQAI
jgi:phosphoribosylamine--glycine ligase